MDTEGFDGTFQGGAFHERFERGKTSGTIRLTGHELVFETAGGRVDLPLSGLEVKRGGASNRLVFFTHSSRPGWSVYTSDRSILKAPELRDLPDVAGQVATIRRKTHLGRAITLGILGLIIAGFAGLYLAKDALVSVVVAQIPVSWEEELGAAAFKQLSASGTFIEDEEVVRRLDALVAPLLDAIREVDDRGYTFEFHIIEDATLNAFALPGGQVTLHTGLILAAESPQEVLGVLGHEIAHVTRQHGLKNMVSSAGLFLVVQAVLGDVSGVLAVLMDNSAYLLSQKFSRDYERDADETGWSYLVEARVDPRGMIEFFRKMKEKHEAMLGEGGEVLQGFLGTHPATRERIERLTARWKELEASGGIEAWGKENVPSAEEFKEFQERIRALLGGN